MITTAPLFTADLISNLDQTAARKARRKEKNTSREGQVEARRTTETSSSTSGY